MISAIIYATDLGLYSSYVLQHAVALARSFRAELHVVHAVQPMGLFAESVLQSYLDEQSLEKLKTGGLDTVMASIEQRVLEGFKEELDDSEDDMRLIASVNVVQGDPSSVILAQAQSCRADLVVIGSHSHGVDVAAPLGRTAAKVLQLATVPVYLVPMFEHRRPH